MLIKLRHYVLAITVGSTLTLVRRAIETAASCEERAFYRLDFWGGKKIKFCKSSAKF